MMMKTTQSAELSRADLIDRLPHDHQMREYHLEEILLVSETYRI